MSISTIEAKWLIGRYQDEGITDNKQLYALCKITIDLIKKQHSVNHKYWGKVLSVIKDELCIEQ